MRGVRDWYAPIAIDPTTRMKKYRMRDGSLVSFSHEPEVQYKVKHGTLYRFPPKVRRRRCRSRRRSA
jgi:hypothetical protein